jgi:hypothetical protein
MYLSMPAIMPWLKRMTMAVLVGTATEFPLGTTAASTVVLVVEVGEAPVIIWLLGCELPPHATAPSSAATDTDHGTKRFITASRNTPLESSRVHKREMQKDEARRAGALRYGWAHCVRYGAAAGSACPLRAAR